jgi:hypothetical protein
MSGFGGFVFTPSSAAAPPTPEDKRAAARSKIDRSLDDIIRDSPLPPRRKSRPIPKDQRKIINLPLTDREVQRYLRTADFDPEGRNVHLRLVLIKDTQRK